MLASIVATYVPAASERALSHVSRALGQQQVPSNILGKLRALQDVTPCLLWRLPLLPVPVQEVHDPALHSKKHLGLGLAGSQLASSLKVLGFDRRKTSNDMPVFSSAVLRAHEKAAATVCGALKDFRAFANWFKLQQPLRRFRT